MCLLTGLVCFVDYPEELAALREESTDLTICPAGNDTFAISREIYTVAFINVTIAAHLEFNFYKLFLSSRRKKPDLILGAWSENPVKLFGEHNIVDYIEMTAHKLHRLLNTSIVWNTPYHTFVTHGINLALRCCQYGHLTVIIKRYVSTYLQSFFINFCKRSFRSTAIKIFKFADNLVDGTLELSIDWPWTAVDALR